MQGFDGKFRRWIAPSVWATHRVFACGFLPPGSNPYVSFGNKNKKHTIWCGIVNEGACSGGFAKTRFGAHGRSWYLNLKRVHHNGLKTVHRTVFFRALRALPPGSNPYVSFGNKKITHPFGWVIFWQPNRDSNPNIQSQSLLCYRYTIRLSAFAY